jgi:hypothetical protein
MEGVGPPCMPMDCLSRPHSGCSNEAGACDSLAMLDEDGGEHVQVLVVKPPNLLFIPFVLFGFICCAVL